MSCDAIESALHALSTDRQARAEFKADAPAFLQKNGLDPAEAGEVQAFDITALLRRGVSPLLTYGFWLTNAEDKTRAAYLRSVRQGGA